jgi:gamma-glutamyltranspeptidase/glutathione hydrolase
MPPEITTMTYRATTSTRPAFIGTEHAVSTAHFLSTAVGNRILELGGNAVDAGVAAGVAMNTVMPYLTSFGGVAPIIIYLADRDEVLTISGVGRWPKEHTLSEHRRRWGDAIPNGVSPVMVPAAPDAWLTALERFGTMTLADVIGPSQNFAEKGFPATLSYRYMVSKPESQEFFDQWPENGAILMPNSRLLDVGERLTNPDLAGLYRDLIDVERSAVSQGRAGAIRAARDHFYTGRPAEMMTRYIEENGGILSMDDMADFTVTVDKPITAGYKDLEIYVCDFWCQGPAVPQILKLLEGYDLAGMGHNSAEYVHVLLEATKLVFADRHHIYGDPEFVEVPKGALLSDRYAAVRREMIRPDTAWPEMPPPGDPGAVLATRNANPPTATQNGAPGEGDTGHVAVTDRWGNVFAATTSDTYMWSPVIPGLGIPPSGRGIQSFTDPEVPAHIAPWKRPRLTPNPALVFRDGRFAMTIGTPGADAQVQVMVQVLLNRFEFGMDVQRAVEAPRVSTYSHPDTMEPHAYFPGMARVESGVDADVSRALSKLGHKVEDWGDLAFAAGCPTVVARDHETGFIWAGADPRRESHATGR